LQWGYTKGNCLFFRFQSNFIFTSEISSKCEIQNSRVKKKVILKVFNCQKWEKKGEYCFIHIFGFHCVAKNIEGWLNIVLYLWFIAIFG